MKRRAEVKHFRLSLAALSLSVSLALISGRRLPDYRLLNLRYGERFTPQDMDKVRPETSGLLGPVRLVAGDR